VASRGRERRRSPPEDEVPLDPAEAVLSDLHLAYSHGQLRVLVGAGMSIQSGLPGWDTLNLRLLEEHLRERYGGVDLPRSQFEETARGLYARLGRDGSADMARMLTAGRFEDQLARALYGDFDVAEELAVRSAHLSLTALARRTRPDFLFTTNFDPLLELALSTPPGGGPPGDWRRHRVEGARSRGVPQVAHLHGWVDPDGATSPFVVLTESDYLELAVRGGGEINRQWRSLINGEGALLVLGMSLNDPNLRRFLHTRRRRQEGSPTGTICAVFERSEPYTDRYLRFYWERGWQIEKLDVDAFDSIPELLRAVAFGPGKDPLTGLPWLEVARGWVASRLPAEDIFSAGWQELASGALAGLADRLRIAFQVPNEERMTASLFLPVNERRGPALITRVATSRGALPGGSAGRAETIRTRSLSVARMAVQGAAGRSFFAGLPVDAPFGSPRIDEEFSPEMVRAWEHHDRYRDWRSLYAIPVIDTPDWLPVAVLTVTSNYSEPFWRRFPDEHREHYLTELKRFCRKATKALLDGHAR
jgi:hypothetical protein